MTALNRDDIELLLRAADHFHSALMNTVGSLTTRGASLTFATESLKMTRSKLVGQLGDLLRSEESRAAAAKKSG